MSKKLKYEEVKNFIEGEYGNGCKLLTLKEEYINTKQKLKLKCKCSNEFETSFIKFKSKNKKQCNKCSAIQKANKKRLNYNDVKKYIESFDGYILLDDTYLNNTTPLKIQCSEGHIYNQSFGNFQSGKRCPICANNQKKSHEQFIKEVKSIYNNKYTVLGTYENNKKKIKIQCNECGNIWSVYPSSFLREHECPKCSHKLNAKLQTKTDEQFRQEVYILVGDEYTFLEPYIKANKKISVIHNNCGHKYKVTPNDFLNGHRCPKCYGSFKKTKEEFIKEIEKIYKNEYTVVGNYVNAKIKTLIRHNLCGNEWLTTPDNILRGKKCPFCNFTSNGEYEINRILTDRHILFCRQMKFDDCRHINSLPFDFAIFNDNKLILLIEYDGKQHYKPIDYFGGEKSYKETIYNDQLKNNYCTKNNIPLLRIPYWEYKNIEKILDKIILQYGIKEGV